MSKQFKRKSMPRLTGSRSRTVTPDSLVLDPSNPLVEPDPKLSQPILTQTRNVNVSPGGSGQTPQGSERRRFPPKTALQQSIHVAPIERVEAMDLDEEEMEEVASKHLEHVQRWFGGVPERSVDPAPYSCSMPVSPEATNAVSGVISIQPVPRAVPSDPQAASVVVSGVIDVRPSSQGAVQSSRCTARTDSEGSGLESDFDDEFDLDEVVASADVGRDIPDDDELSESECNIMNNVSRAMDEAADRLNSVSDDFIWQENFDTFGATPEVFSGPSPGPVKDYDTPYEAFTDIWSRDFMEHIVQETNRYARQTIEQETTTGTLKESSRLWKDTDADEMYLFFAVYILMGIKQRPSAHEYWNTGYLEMPLFKRLMSYNRYILLNKFLHFVDNSDESQNWAQSKGALSAKLAKVAPVLEHLNNKFSTLYDLQTDIAIDETLTLFKGRLSWLQEVRSNACFGIKSFELCESKTGYLHKFKICTGKSFERGDIVAPSVDLASKSTQAVLELLKGLENRGHFVTMDNFYNCPALARYLKSLGFDCLGTLRPNRKHVPVEVAKVPENVPSGTIIARHCGDVSCLAWKDFKMVMMISTYHTDETFVSRRAGRDLVKPSAVRDYSNTMGGVDLKNQKLSMYQMDSNRCLRWYMKIFTKLLNVSVLNAFILLTESFRRRGMSGMTHRKFRVQLADSLVYRHHPQGNSLLGSGSEFQRLNKNVVHSPGLTPNSKRSYCRICSRIGTMNKVNFQCATCNAFLCPGDCWVVWHSAEELPGNDDTCP